MNATKKMIIWVGGLIVIIGAIVVVFPSLNSLVEKEIEKYGSEVTQTPIRVNGVDIVITSGEGSIGALSVGNPKGFEAPNIFILGNIKTSIDTSTVTESTIVIKEISINAPKVFYEINALGRSNLDALKKNIASATSVNSDGSEGSGKAIKLIIKRLTIVNGEVDVRITVLGNKQLKVALPKIVLKDIGQNSGGAGPVEVAELVLGAILKSTKGAVTGIGLDKYLGKNLNEVKNLGLNLGETLAEGAGEAVKGGAAVIKGLF
ncbi:MAG: hypothetical protein HON51_03640 [Gammaproteobacteria bacterium]|jgi:uncharacterized protein involved in outer membrane biogenesis|nr:hypothetical protein [Gammaproteobacteria bacterium]MBT5221762.1 hypothetical protein [Gammaproteobacteria bacterium]MBT5826464.1 hypothetical protein [Gammaproteobacteria bacterium]MBT5967633.1 hypothetical protein [Gammaproteobacteria bacterium]MBT6418772.1 hypothetical protein [Gammaproteobacteria bacterium]